MQCAHCGANSCLSQPGLASHALVHGATRPRPAKLHHMVEALQQLAEATLCAMWFLFRTMMYGHVACQ